MVHIQSAREHVSFTLRLQMMPADRANRVRTRVSKPASAGLTAPTLLGVRRGFGH